MNNQEFSNGFDTLVSSYRRFKDFDNKEILDSVEFDEYEKSLLLTRSQEEIMIGLYNGTIKGESLEQSEELRRLLANMVIRADFGMNDVIRTPGLTEKSKLFEMPENLAFIIYEEITYDDSSLGCYDHSKAAVVPIRHDEYERVKNNPFRGPTKYRALRLDAGTDGTLQMVEIIPKYEFDTYTIRYLKRPRPIILEDLPEGLTIEGQNQESTCELNPLLHQMILERAVMLALRAKTNISK
jgi:hypothetical protein